MFRETGLPWKDNWRQIEKQLNRFWRKLRFYGKLVEVLFFSSFVPISGSLIFALLLIYLIDFTIFHCRIYGSLKRPLYPLILQLPFYLPWLCFAAVRSSCHTAIRASGSTKPAREWTWSSWISAFNWTLPGYACFFLISTWWEIRDLID